MSTLTSLPREVLRWLLSLDLSFPIKNIKRDFSNGFLYAEILSRFFPADIQMHSFENVTSLERKKANWVVLERLFKKRNIPIDLQQIEAVITAEDDAASDVLQTIFSFINSDAYRESLLLTGSQEHSGTASPCDGSRYPSVGKSKSVGRLRGMAAEESHVSGYCYGPDGNLYPAMYAASQDQQQAAMQPMMWQQVMAQQEQQAGCSSGACSGGCSGGCTCSRGRRKAAAADAAALQEQMQQIYVQMMGGMPAGALQPSPLDDLAFSRKPRPVDFQPYSLSDYEAANFDVKKAKGYWQLGRLGQEETQELQAKREAREKVKELSKRIGASNSQRLAASPPAKPQAKEPSARQRAVEYAKSSVPKPELLKQRSSLRKRGGSAAAAAAAAAAAGGGEQDGEQEGGQQQSRSLEKLQQQHDLYVQQIEQMRQELEAKV